MKKVIVLTLFLLLAGCSVSAGEPTAIGGDQTVVGQGLAVGNSTITAQPPVSLQSTPLPSLDFDALNLHSLVILDGDLPQNYAAGQVLQELPKLFAAAPPADRSFYQLIEQDGSGAGGVAILLYSDRQQSAKAYDHLLQGMGIEESEPVNGMGEHAQVYVFYQAGVSFRFVDLLFERCGAVVHIRLGETFNKESVISYAQKLDHRLTEMICR